MINVTIKLFSKKYMYVLDLDNTEKALLEHCIDMSLLRREAPPKKKDSILDALFAAIVRSRTSFQEVISCIDDVKNGLVIDIDFFHLGGNVENYIAPRWRSLAKALWRQRSVGLGTPNAASGEGELMFIFLSPEISKPTKGDLKVGDELIELKGEGVRVSGNISGKNFRRKTLELQKKYNFTPNVANRTGLAAVELEKVQHETHWRAEMKKLTLSDRKKFVADYLKCIDGKYHIIDHLFNVEFDFNQFRKEIVKILYSVTVSEGLFDKFIILGDGSNAKIFSTDYEDFKRRVDNGEVNIESDYFRINQNANIGWYIS